MWSRELFGTDVYHLITAFVIYSMIGWLVESIYMSICNKKITNRGFAKGPFCPIYGFGAVLGNLLLTPFKFNPVLLYFVAAFLATSFEYIVGLGMIKFLGELWWDYNDKFMNYKGIICLESTIAWGFYGIGICYFLNDFLYGILDTWDSAIVTKVVMVILFIVIIDYIFQLAKVFDKDLGGMIKERLHAIKARWY